LAAGSQKLKRQGLSSRLTRGCIPAAAALVAGLLTIVLPLMPGKLLPIICTMLAFSVSDLIFILGPVAIAEVTPIQQRGAMLGMNNALATLAGPLAPAITGMIVDLAGGPATGFRTAFMVAGGLVTVGALAGLWLIDPAADVRTMGGDISMKVPHQDLRQQA
jgi:MFS transporter, ACS family, D-galactonate transporter